MKRIFHVAVREFLATAATKGFIIGLLIMPAMIIVMVLVGPRLFSQRSFRAEGQIAIVDPTGVVAPELRTALDPQTLEQRRAEQARLALANLPQAMRPLADSADPASPEGRAAVDMMLGQTPNLRVLERPPTVDLQEAKQWLTEPAPGGERHLALVVVHPDAVAPGPSGKYGTYDLFVPTNLDDRIEGIVYQTLRDSIVTARARAQNLDRDSINALTRVERARSVAVTKDGDRRNVRPLNQAMPFVFVGLLLFGVLFGGQALLTSTVEEKSSRVVEVLLSAVSPLELMAGKILGQMGVSLVALGLYVGVGLAVLLSFALLGLVDPWLVLYLVIFFVIAYLLVGSLMAAIGAAVNEVREAQSLMTPLMLVLMTPWFLAFPISRDPNSTFSTVISFVPPVNTFAMILRMASTSPPPSWQVWLSIGVGIVSVVAAVWFASKVFRIGLLMYGKPPNFATLVRWVRAA